MKHMLLIFAFLVLLAPSPGLANPDPQPQVSLARVAQNPNALVLTIKLADGWHTYWKNAGDAGIAPSFAFTGLKGADVLFPVPERFNENGLTTFGYNTQVSLPIVFAKQMTPHAMATVSYAACAEICVPLTATISTADSAPIPQAEFDTIMARVPQQASGGTAKISDQGQVSLDLSPYRGRALVQLPYGIVIDQPTDTAGRLQFTLPAGISKRALQDYVAPVVVDDAGGPVELVIGLGH